MATKSLRRYLDEAKKRDSYWVEQAKLDFSLALERRRRRIGMSYAAIAKTIGTSAAYITKVFRGDANLTIESMIKLARATGGRINILITDESVDSHAWLLNAAFHQPVANESSSPTSGTGTIVSLDDYRDKNRAA